MLNQLCITWRYDDMRKRYGMLGGGCYDPSPKV